ARAIGVTIPQSTLFQATEVIQRGHGGAIGRSSVGAQVGKTGVDSHAPDVSLAKSWPNLAVESTPNSWSDVGAQAIGRGSPRAFGFHGKTEVGMRLTRGDNHVVQHRRRHCYPYPQSPRGTACH